jgi:hypothetical protein
MIIQKSTADLTVSAHAIKSILGIKLSRAAQRHASAMGFESANHLITAVKGNPVERDFEAYVAILKVEVLANHQIEVTEPLVERLRTDLVTPLK